MQVLQMKQLQRNSYSFACAWTRPVDVSEAKLAQAVLPHLEEVREAQLPIRAGLATHLHQVRLQRSTKCRRSPPPICQGTSQYTWVYRVQGYSKICTLTPILLHNSGLGTRCGMPGLGNCIEGIALGSQK